MGAALFFTSACAFCALPAYTAPDTWIALAAGRRILQTWPSFPTADPFSYTTNGAPWLNQNWLSDAALWVLYDRVSPDAVVIATWLLCAIICFSVVLCVHMRGVPWRMALIVGGVAGVASRDWLVIRAATVQFVLLGLLWIAVTALLMQGTRRRWWPLALIVPVFLVWPHAHGSFVFPYGLMGLFLACSLGGRGLEAILGRSRSDGATGAFASSAGGASATDQSPRRVPLLDWRQGALATMILAVTAYLGGALSPYGWNNYLHLLTIGGSDTFRQINEWVSPFRLDGFPPVGRFWVALAIACAAPLVVLLRGTGPDHRRTKRASAPRAAPLGLILFDIASVVVATAIALWARRFAPIFFIVAFPAVAYWTQRWSGALAARERHGLSSGVQWATLPGCVVVTALTVAWGMRDMVDPYVTGPQPDLLGRATRADLMPSDAMEFLQRNRLTPNVFVPWAQADTVLFYVPGAKVFIDGRDHQVYSEEQHERYVSFTELPVDQGARAVQMLVDAHTDAVLLRNWEMAGLARMLERVDEPWVRVFQGPRSRLYVRPDSELLRDLEARNLDGTLWRPDDGSGNIAAVPPSPPGGAGSH